MKLLSVVIPCYNSQEYMRNCIESLLPGGEEVEILIINDGSIDKTAEIADEYASQYPNIVKAIHQENGGHGEAINTGLRHATGLYFKVVDSDDWVDLESYEQIINKLKELTYLGTPIDMLISNFVYEKEGSRRNTVMHYENILPQNRLFTWNEVGRFRKGKYILMHSIIYRTNLLRECNLELPKHTFYVDNLFVYVPLPYVKNMYYLNVDFYRYFIGREDQSVNETVMIRRIDQQIKVNKLMLELIEINKVENAKRRKYMFNHLEITTVITSILLIRSGTTENLSKKSQLWRYIRSKDIRLYFKLRTGLLGMTTNLPGKAGRKIAISAYKLSQKVVGFN
jgi:glycosyltransferase involved in cell wall biosynthesis